jgi:hypothetical protein
VDINLSWLNNNYQRALATYVRKCDAHRLREVEPHHRYGAMVCFLWQTYQDTIDFAVDLHDKLIQKVEDHAKVAFNLQLVKKRKSINESLSMFQRLTSQHLQCSGNGSVHASVKSLNSESIESTQKRITASWNRF